MALKDRILEEMMVDSPYDLAFEIQRDLEKEGYHFSIDEILVKVKKYNDGRS
jgi:hypothetical protein